MPFKKGQSGNPRGRPPKSRALTEILEKAGAKKLDGKTPAKKVLAEKVWQGLATGCITFERGEEWYVITLDADDYIALARLVLNQVDGPPRTELDLTSGGEAVEIVINQIPARDRPPVEADARADES